MRYLKLQKIKQNSFKWILFWFLDFLDVFAGVVVSLIVASVVFSTIFDYQFETQTDENEKSKPSEILTTFSLKRNWKLLLATSKSEDDNLKFIDVFRTFAMFAVIQNHCVLYTFMMPSSNSEFIEEVRIDEQLDDWLKH